MDRGGRGGHRGKGNHRGRRPNPRGGQERREPDNQPQEVERGGRRPPRPEPGPSRTRGQGRQQRPPIRLDEAQPGPSRALQPMLRLTEQPPVAPCLCSLEEEVEALTISEQTSEDLLRKHAGIWLRGVNHAQEQKHGTLGKRIKLIANMFKLTMKLKNEAVFYHYDVTVEAPAGNGDDAPTVIESKAKNRQVVQQMIRQYEANYFAEALCVYDAAKGMYTRRMLQLPENGRLPVTFINPDDNQERQFIVEITPTQDFQIVVPPNAENHSQEVIQVLDIVLRYGATLVNIPVGKSKIFKPLALETKPRINLGRNKELAFGFYQSARNCEAGLMLNVDQVGGVFHQSIVTQERDSANLMRVAERILGLRKFFLNTTPRIHEHYIRRLSQDLAQLKFRATHLNHTRRIREISLISASEIEFYCDSIDPPSKISVAEYFKRQYFKLRYPNMPCVVSGQRGNERYFPLEVCELLSDQFVGNLRNLPAEVVAQIPEATAQRPHKRFEGILDAVNTINQTGRDYLAEFEINLSNRPVEVAGRQLPKPKLSNEKSYFPPLTSWLVLDITNGRQEGDPRYQDLGQRFCERLKQVTREQGFEITDPHTCPQYEYQSIELLQRQVFVRAVQTYKPQMIFFLIPNDPRIYAAIKILGNLQMHNFGVLTQCVKWDRKKPIDDYASTRNLLKKVQAKLGGTAQILEEDCLPPKMKNKRIMIVGIDVSHPHPEERRNKPSLAACVASYDEDFVKYSTSITVQRPERPNLRTLVEEITRLGPLMQKNVEFYKERNHGNLPESIIVYRDGVSEGQFEHVMRNEVGELLELFADSPDTKITYVVVQKGHHVRFMTSNGGNAPSGTVVDTTVTDANVSDSFIFGHDVIMTKDEKGNRVPRGTARPGRYRLLFDNNNYSADDVQILTYYLCYLYARCDRPISVPAPVRYADLVANLARIYSMEAGFVGEEGLTPEEIQRIQNHVTVHNNLKDLLHFV